MILSGITHDYQHQSVDDDRLFAQFGAHGRAGHGVDAFIRLSNQQDRHGGQRRIDAQFLADLIVIGAVERMVGEETTFAP